MWIFWFFFLCVALEKEESNWDLLSVPAHKHPLCSILLSDLFRPLRTAETRFVCLVYFFIRCQTKWIGLTSFHPLVGYNQQLLLVFFVRSFIFSSRYYVPSRFSFPHFRFAPLSDWCRRVVHTVGSLAGRSVLFDVTAPTTTTTIDDERKKSRQRDGKSQVFSGVVGDEAAKKRYAWLRPIVVSDQQLS